MFEELGITKEKYDDLVKKVGEKAIFRFLSEFPEFCELTNKLRLMFYMDDKGIFVGRKRPMDYICMAIFESMPADDKKYIFGYMEYIEDQ